MKSGFNTQIEKRNLQVCLLRVSRAIRSTLLLFQLLGTVIPASGYCEKNMRSLIFLINTVKSHVASNLFFFFFFHKIPTSV